MHVLPLLFSLLFLGAQSDAPPVVAEARGEAVADTLRFTLDSGDALVIDLPGDPDATFRVERAPALSWLVGRSFFWQTVPAERGREYIHILRDTASQTDTLILVIDVGTE